MRTRTRTEIGATAAFGMLAAGTDLSGADAEIVLLLAAGALIGAITISTDIIYRQLRAIRANQTGRNLADLPRPEDVVPHEYDIDGARVLVGVRRGAPPPTARQVRDAIRRAS